MANNEPTHNIDAFLGIRNKEQSKRQPQGALDSAINVDIDDSGCIVLRDGYAKSFNFTNITAAFSTQDERRTFVVDNGDLKLVDSFGVSTTLYSGIPASYIHWLEVDGYILMSSGHLINVDNRVSLWRIPNPIAPVFIVISGNLKAGQYQLTLTYTDELGREGGASSITTVNVSDDSGITITPIYGGNQVNVYVSDTNGTEMYLYGRYMSGNVTITTSESLVYPIEKAQLSSYPAPQGISNLAFFNGQIYCSVLEDGVSTLFFSEPFWWNLFDLQNNFIQISGEVRLLAAHREGLIIATDKEIHAYSNEGSLIKLADYGVPKGKAYAQDDNGNIFIHSNQGLCVGLPFKNLTEEKVSLPSGDHCFTELIEKNGMQKIVILTDGNGDADNKLAS